MKKFLMMAAAALMTLVACEEKVEPNKDGGDSTQPEQTADEISITPEKKSFSQEGGVQKVIVTSTGDWTLKLDETSEKERATEWITVKDGVESGKDGDIVTFEVKENYTGKQLTAVFVFTCGKAEAKFTAISESGEVNFITLASEEKVDLKYTDKEATVQLNTNLNYRAVEVEVSAEEDWCKLDFPQEAGEKQVNLVFSLKQNEGEQAREALITIKGERVEPVTVTISQRAQTKISTDKTEYLFEQEGGSIDVKVTSNVEYTFEVTEGAWIKHTQKEVGVETITADASQEKRLGTVTITEKNPYPGEEPVKLEVVVRQAPKALVSHAIDMNGMRLRPSWEDGAESVTALNNFTIELLLNADELTKQISTIFGIESYWLLRCGDTGIETDHMHLAGGQVAANENAAGQMLSASQIMSDKTKLKTKQWCHVAVSLENDQKMLFSAKSLVKIYVDGELVATGRTYNNPFNLAMALADSWDPYGPKRHKFYFGYSWENTRDFVGRMTEIRIWNKVLTSAELKAENHAYYVDPKAEGLLAYWKFNEAKEMLAEGFNQMCIPDETGHNFHLICETLQGEDWNNKVAPKLVDVNLPE